MNTHNTIKEKKAILGIDVGGTFIKYGLVDHQNKLFSFGQITTPKTRNGIIKALVKLALDNRGAVKGIGVGLPGRINLKTGSVVNVSTMPLSNTPVAKIICRETGLPIKIDNDARCFALAEALVGSGKNYQTVLGMVIGTGVGGGIVLNKKLFRGRGNAGEFGHHYINFKEVKDLEDYLGSARTKLTPAYFIEIEKKAKAGDKKALRFWDNIGLTLGFACLNLTHIFDPDIIVLGGKLAKNYSLFRACLAKTVKRYCLVKPPRIIQSKLIDRAGIIGAALLFKQQG